MATLALSIVCFFITVADANGQHLGPGDKYVPSNKAFFDFYFVYLIIHLFYALFYIIYVIVYFTKRGKIEESNVKVKKAGDYVSDEDVSRIINKENAEVLDGGQNSAVPTHVQVIDNTEVDKKVARRYAHFVSLSQFILLIVLVGALFIIDILTLLGSQLIFWILFGVFVILLFVVLFFHFYLFPKLVYKKITHNPSKSSIRVFKDHLENVNIYPSGDEVIYVFDFKKSKIKDVDGYYFIKTSGGKRTIAALVNKEQIGEEMSGIILNKFKE